MKLRQEQPHRDFVGYGGRPPAVHWPNDSLLALNFVINYEEGAEHYEYLGDRRTDGLGEINWALSGRFRDLAMESVYEYGSRAGIWRLFRIFDEYRIVATIFACGLALERNLDVAQAMRPLGHEVASHGYRWSEPWYFSREEEREQIRLAVSSINASTGQRPVGWYWRYCSNPWTRQLLVADGGFTYDSDSYNDDLPWFADVDGKRHLVIPYTQTYNDVHYVVSEGGYASPDDFVSYLRRAVIELISEGREGSPKMMSVGLHPRWSGQAARANALREFLEFVRTMSVWVARRDEIAAWWIDHAAEWSS